MRKFMTFFMIALLPLSLLPNIAHALEQNTLTQQIDNIKVKAIKNWHRIQAMKQKIEKITQNEESSSPDSSLRSKEAKEAVGTSVEYKGKVSNTKQDEYVFQVANTSVLNIHSVTGNSRLDYLLVGTDDTGSENFYMDGDTLPAGTYTLTIFGDSATLIDYDYVLSGISFTEQPDTTLPKLTFTSPNFPISRLAKGTTNLQFTGTTDTQTYVDNNESYSKDFIGDFQFSVPVHPGNNFVNFQTMTASGNAIHMNLTLTVPAIKRIDGSDRFAVAANVAKDMPPSDTVVIASGLDDKFADALAGSPVAGIYQAPILMTSQKTLPSATVEEIQRRQPSKAIIMGGIGTVDPTVEAQLRNLGVATINRIDGSNRFAVSVNAAKELKKVLGSEMRDGALVTSGMVFPDALSASPIASDSLAPILLVSSKGLPPEIETYLKANPTINQMTSVGGSVPKQAIDRLTSIGRQVTKIEGHDRYDVNLNVAKVFDANLNYLVFAVGTKFPDALSGGPFASSLSENLSPLFLTGSAQLPANLKTYLDGNKADIQVIYILGGEDSVSTNVATQLNQYTK